MPATSKLLKNDRLSRFNDTEMKKLMIETSERIARLLKMKDDDPVIPTGQTTLVRACLSDGTLVEGVVVDRSKTGIQIIGDAGGVSVGDEGIVTILLPNDINQTFRSRVNLVDSTLR